MKKWQVFKVEEYKTSQIVLLIAFGIILAASVLIFLSKCTGFSFGRAGSIGDTIGGITAPFINGLAAILVFVAFKEQNKANEIFKNQEKTKIILDQIESIQEDKLNIEEVISGIQNRLHVILNTEDRLTLVLLNKLSYFISEIKLTNELIEEYKGEKDFVYRKLFYLYAIRYKDSIDHIAEKLQNRRMLPTIHASYQLQVEEIILGIKYLDNNFKDARKFVQATNQLIDKM